MACNVKQHFFASRGHARDAFTLVEMLVVIGIIGILAATLITSFSNVKMVAKQSEAQKMVSEVATAFTVYLQKERKWPDEWVGENGEATKSEMDPEVCWEFQRKKMLDLSTYERESDGTIKERLASNINKQSLDRFGMLDPFARTELKRKSTTSDGDAVSSGRTFRDHRLQFRLDTNYDGYVDSEDRVPPPEGVRVRAAAIVWSRGPDGRDDFEKSTGHYPVDDRLSWAYAKAKRDN